MEVQRTICGVEQFGSSPGSCPGGRWFKSNPPQLRNTIWPDYVHVIRIVVMRCLPAVPVLSLISKLFYQIRRFNERLFLHGVDMREKSTRYKRIGKKLISERPELEDIRDFDIKVAFLSSDTAKLKDHRIVFGDCTRVTEKYAWCCKYDFFITIYEPNVVDFSPDQIRILLLHELMHCGVDVSGNEPKCYCKPHDVEEFDEIMKQYGAHWEVEGDE